MRTFTQKPKSIHETRAGSGRHAAPLISQPQEHAAARDFPAVAAPGLVGNFGHFATNLRGGMPSQAALSISDASDYQEREADRRADLAMRMRQSAEVGNRDREPVPKVSVGSRSNGEEALQPEDRRFFESRFKHNFADVRVYSDHEANESARALKARAFTIGNRISFAPGEYRPGTDAGRTLIAHELAHVMQQRGIGGRDAVTIQRQPDDGTKDTPPPAKQAPPATQQTPPAAKQSTLKSEGVDAADAVAVKTPQIIDTVLQRNKRLAPYIGDRLTGGLKIAEKGHFVKELSDANFDSAYRKTYEENAGDTVPSYVMGFYDPNASTIHLRPDAKFGTALHEAVHRLAAPNVYSLMRTVASKISEDLVRVMVEGVTAYFTDMIVQDEGLPNFIDAYGSLKKKAENIVAALGKDGFDVMATYNFKTGSVLEIGKRLGISEKQYAALKGTVVSEILKKVNALL
jgi:hypothetical protein